MSLTPFVRSQIWPFHRTQCKAKSAAFVVPSLTPEEAASLRPLDREVFWLNGGPSGQNMPNWLRTQGLYGGNWTDFVTSLTQDAPPSPRRAALLAFARLHIHECYNRDHLADSPLNPPSSAWLTGCGFLTSVITPALMNEPVSLSRTSIRTDRPPLEVAKPVLVQALTAFTLLDMYSDGPAKQTNELYELLTLALKRTQEEIKKTPIEAQPRMFLEGIIGSGLATLQYIKPTRP
ncbi:hypothetical protein JCM8097_001031 [Rhodosporidiobolus ruineniae]